jgi:hypothetical protein
MVDGKRLRRDLMAADADVEDIRRAATEIAESVTDSVAEAAA